MSGNGKLKPIEREHLRRRMLGVPLPEEREDQIFLAFVAVALGIFVLVTLL